jgi:hypothetical protein
MFYVHNQYVGNIPCTAEQEQKAYDLHRRFNDGSDVGFTERHFWTADGMIVSAFGNMVIGILPDGSSHS